MLKLLLTLAMTVILSVVLLQLRQQRLELNYQTNKLHNQIRRSQAQLWNQQLRIAEYTAPNAISNTVGVRSLQMVPESPLPARGDHWIESSHNPDAE
jgi:cell division protein FtsL